MTAELYYCLVCSSYWYEIYDKNLSNFYPSSENVGRIEKGDRFFCFGLGLAKVSILKIFAGSVIFAPI